MAWRDDLVSEVVAENEMQEVAQGRRRVQLWPSDRTW